MTRIADAAYVAAQYADSARFDARVDIYRLYDTSPQRWQSWLFERLRLVPGERVLELGCGTANLWLDNAQRIPAGLRTVLSDLSGGMLEAARARLGSLVSRFAAHVEREIACAGALHVGIAAGLVTGIRC